MGEPVIDIDGSILEGGGQILRMSIVFSSLLKKPVRIFNIRAKRSKSGLGAQHLEGLLLAADICQARLEKAALGSTEIVYYPGIIESGNYSAICETAGSVSLMLQVALPLLLYGSGKSMINLQGGTNADFAPPIDYYIHLAAPLFNHFFGLDVVIRDKRRGFFPKGGGEVDAQISAIQEVKPIILTEKGKITSVWGNSCCSGNVSTDKAMRMVQSSYNNIIQKYPELDQITSIHSKVYSETQAYGSGCGLYLYAETSTKARFSAGINGIKDTPEDNGHRVAINLLKSVTSESCTDEYTQDQLIVFMTLAKGKSTVKTGSLTLHTQTAIYIAELMTGVKFVVTKTEDGCNLIECEGLGLLNERYVPVEEKEKNEDEDEDEEEI